MVDDKERYRDIGDRARLDENENENENENETLGSSGPPGVEIRRLNPSLQEEVNAGLRVEAARDQDHSEPSPAMNPFVFLDETMASVEGQDPGGAAGLSAEAKAASLDETHLEDPALAGNQPAIGTGSIRIGRYAVLSKLGEGGMGTVYSAYDEELDRRVAIKLVREHLPGKTMGDARMQREAQAMARLSHPNVVQIYDVGTHWGQVFIAMEFVRGSTLSEWQEAINPEAPANRRKILDMYIQAGRGLAAAHRRNLVHRDFKPDNVLVGEDGRARVLDFGLAASGRPFGAEGRGEVAVSGHDEPLTSNLTRTGAVPRSAKRRPHRSVLLLRCALRGTLRGTPL